MSFWLMKGSRSRKPWLFGDHENDIEMLKGVGIGGGYGECAAKWQKTAANYVTASNNEDGIARGSETLMASSNNT